MGAFRDNWRVGLLILLLLGSTFALFSPTVGGSGTDAPGFADEGPSNLRFGLQLSGGTRIRAPLVGLTAEEVQFGNAQPSAVEQQVADELRDASVTDVIARPTGSGTGTVEVTAENVSREEFRSALNAADFGFGEIRRGVTEATRQQTVDVLRSKINEAGLSGGSVRVVTTSTGEHFVLVEVPGRDRGDVIDLVNSKGTVEVQAYFRQNGSYTTRTVLTQDDFQTIGTAQQSQQGPFVPVTLKDAAAQRFQQAMVETGIAQQGGTRCTYQENPNATEPCLLVSVDGQVVNAFGMTPSLAQDMRSGEWASDPRFSLSTRNISEAQEVAINLRAGALPAKLDLGADGRGTSSYISPAQGENFKRDSLITGLIAVLAVSVVVFIRYGEFRVAAPMVVTALSEVVVLLGLAAAIQYPLDLSVIAGFIAVIGTGVDDLIIIADEVMAEGDVRSRKVFQSRFRKAFWVIGAAAATTIIAMSPLAVLSLGDLKGFAIFTILGVIVGVLVTRPAYGDILRSLLTENR